MRLLSLSEVSIQPRASNLKFDDLAEDSEKDSVPNLSTKVHRRLQGTDGRAPNERQRVLRGGSRGRAKP